MKLSTDNAEKLGRNIINLLGLKVRADMVQTSGGTKTALGLGLTVQRSINELVKAEIKPLGQKAKTTRIYIGNQIARILNGEKEGIIKLQISQGSDKTNFLNITEEQLLKIELILIKG